MAKNNFWGNLLDSITGKANRDITQSQIDAATQIALEQAANEAAKYTPEALAEKRKLVIGVVSALVIGTVTITILYLKFK